MQHCRSQHMSQDAPLAAITITPTAQAGTYNVDVKSHATTRHEVTVTSGYLRELNAESYPPELVLRVAFQFLLEREPNTAILRSFDLREVERYFPEFRREIGPRLTKAQSSA